MQDTPWYQSRTIWVSVLTVMAGILKQLGVVELEAETVDGLAGFVITGIGLAFAILRADTSTPIKGTAKAKK